MNRILLVTRPKYDDSTEYLASYASLVLKEAKRLNVKKKDFEAEKANPDEVSKFISKLSPKLLFLNGHGDSECLKGHKGEILFSVSKNLDLLKDRIIYARACHAGLSFGEKVVENNEGCFIGYKNPFSFWIDGARSATPLKDNIAKLFLFPSNEIINSLLKGKTTQEAHQISKKMMVESMKKILDMNQKRELGAMGWLGILWNNYEGQVLHGNESSSF